MADNIDYQLTDAESEALRAVTEGAMARAGAKGGSIGGMLGGLFGGGAGVAGGGAGGRSGGESGGRLGSRFTKPLTAETVIEVTQDPDAARECARAAIAMNGEAIDDPNCVQDGSVWGIVQSGAMNMAPALVRVEAEPLAPRGSRVHVRATGKEGLIKQRIGAKAADRIAEAIVQQQG